MERLRVILVPLCALTLFALPLAASADTSFAELLGQLETTYQLPSGILWKIALAENDGKATGCASTSSACGMFQFTTSTWLSDTKALYGQPLDLSLRNSPDLSAKAAAFELDAIRTQAGSSFTQANVNLSTGLYLGYFLGSGGAKKLLAAYMQDPAQSSCAILPPQCSANQSVMANRSVSQLINWASQKMQVSGVPNIAGNFECANGTSYAYSYCDVSSSNFLPANTVIPPNPYGQYATVFPSATNGAPAPGLTGAPLPQPTAQNPTVSTGPQSTTTSGSACTPRYYCSNSTVYYQSNSCATSVFQSCQYGCLGTICAPALGASGSSANTSSGTAGNSLLTSGSSASPLLNSSLLTSGIVTLIEGQAAPSGTVQPTFVQAGANPAYGNVTLTNNSTQASLASGSPLSGILNQLTLVMNGLLSYLGSL